MTESNYLYVAAIDFGTTYSGYAFSSRTDFKRDPLEIHANQSWNAGSTQLASLKTPTCLLLDSDKKFVAFGYEAENEYADLISDQRHGDYFYFSRIKMYLYQNKVHIYMISNQNYVIYYLRFRTYFKISITSYLTKIPNGI